MSVVEAEGGPKPQLHVSKTIVICHDCRWTQEHTSWLDSSLLTLDQSDGSSLWTPVSAFTKEILLSMLGIRLENTAEHCCTSDQST